jgi:hypothetical protein
MLRFLLAPLLTLGVGGVASAQSNIVGLISSTQNVNCKDSALHGKDFTPECKTPWSIDIKTLHGGKQEGVRLVTIDNGKLKIVLIPTRGMGILNVTMGDLTLGWKSPVTEVVHPKHINLGLRGGLGWLEGFNEWLARCGLENTGQAGQDEIINNVGDKTTVDLTLHGKIANIPASEVEVLLDKKPPHRLIVRGIMHEKMLFGPKFELITEVSTEPGSDTFLIEDKIINKGSQPAEYQILYHYNFGKPLLGDGAKLHVPVEKVTPYNANAAKAVKTWNSFAGPVPGYVEQVYLMRPLADKEGRVNALLHNPKADRAVVLTYAKKELPYLTLWKNTGHDDDGYVIGIEPGVSFPNMRKVERQAGRVPKLDGGASHTMRMEFTLIDTAKGVTQAARRVEEVQKSQNAIVNTTPGAP